MSVENGGEPSSRREEDSNAKNVCRDFLNGICHRGSRCKFNHPQEKQKEVKNDVEGHNFCLDFQNQGCTRSNCRFVHAKADDVDQFKRTGDVSHSLARAIAAMPGTESINGIPFCRDFEVNGACSRGQGCRYWHVSREQERERRHGPGGGGGGSVPPSRGVNQYAPPVTSAGMRRRAAMPFEDYGELAVPYKRSMTEDRHIMELERRTVEQAAEIESLRRELRRERERYEDLLSLFRSATSGGASRIDATAAAIPPLPSSTVTAAQLGRYSTSAWHSDAADAALMQRHQVERYDERWQP